MKKPQFDILEYPQIALTLKSIAAKYPKASPENKAIEVAAKGLMFACESTVYANFERFLKEFGEKLSPKQKAHLKRMGLLPRKRSIPKPGIG
jgi:hypothetical protein